MEGLNILKGDKNKFNYSLGHKTYPVLFIHFFGALKSQFDTSFWSWIIGRGLQFPILVLDLNYVQNMVELWQF